MQKVAAKGGEDARRAVDWRSFFAIFPDILA
jgi:hypothetical protein